ncbi:ARM repeat-containing protein [Auriculariales sp. MPI-PUGE-AT-0066]|nr:ARM repeat-containing protein [Auriculariales sp. MPI-PUGE-AT-0066]
MEQIAQAVQGSLSADSNTRMAAELALNKLFAQPDTGLALATITVSQDVDPIIRQTAGVLTRKYVTEYWGPYFSQFQGPATPFEIKQQIRGTIFKGLSDPNRKIRSATAYIVSTIAHSDWPDEYPDLLPSLVAALSVSPDAVHGSLQVFTEFMKNDLTEDQLIPVIRQLLPALLQVLGQPQLHSFATRARTIVVFRHSVVSLVMLKEHYPDVTKEASGTVLPVWLDAFRQLLEADPRADIADPNNWDALAVKIQIFKTLNTVIASFPTTLDVNLSNFINTATSHLIALASTYATYYLSSDGPTPPISEEDPEGVTLPALVAPIFDFLGALVRKGKLREWLQNADNTRALVGAVLGWAQITVEDEAKWEDSPNTFVADDEDDSQIDNLRTSAFDLLSILLEKAAEPAITTLNVLINSTLEESNAHRQGGSAIWWKPLEALLAALAAVANELLDHKDQVNFNILFADVLPSLMSMHDTPFLVGRAFVFASRLSSALPVHLAQQYLGAATDILEGNGGVVIKISAVKAVKNFCQNISDPSIAVIAPRLLKALGPFFSSSEDTLSLTIETLVAVLELDGGKWLTPDLASMLANALLDVWAKNIKDPILLSVLTDAFSALAKAQYPPTVSTALPRLCTVINNVQAEESWVATSAIEIASCLFRGAPAESGLGDGVFAQVAPVVFGVLDKNEDRDVLQAGIVCLTLFVRKDCPQILAHPDGLNLLLRLISRTLAPVNGNESGGLFVGDLMLHLLRRAGSALLPSLQDLLQALLDRLTTAKTGTFIQSLIVPFAYLLYTQRDPVLDMLERTTTATGTPGLQILLTAWSEHAETFIGFWPQRLSNLGLSALFASERPSVQGITVRGDLIVRPETSNVIMTRSRAKQAPHEYTSILFPVKALKLLLHDLQSGGDAAAISAASTGAELVDSDDDGEDWADEEKIEGEQWLSDLLGPGAKGFEDDDVVDDQDDEDFADDPISQIDMKAHLITFLKECAARNTNNFNAIVDGQLKLEETLVIHHALQS